MVKKSLFILLLLICSANAEFKAAAAPQKLAGDEIRPCSSPIWSPDGRSIAFTSANYSGLWVMRADGSEISEINNEPGAGFGFQWSPDSRAILARVSRMDGRKRLQALKLYDLDSKKETLLGAYQTGRIGLPRWSADGQQVLCYVSGKLQISASGRTSAVLQRKPLQPLCLLNMDQAMASASEAADFSLIGSLNGKRILNMVTSYDGAMVAFDILGGPLCVMKSDGTGLLELGEGEHPAFSPDGKHIVYMITRDDGHTITGSDLFIIAIDGSGKQNLTQSEGRSEMHPSWSPDGHAIAYDINETGEIWSLPVIPLNQ